MANRSKRERVVGDDIREVTKARLRNIISDEL